MSSQPTSISSANSDALALRLSKNSELRSTQDLSTLSADLVGDIFNAYGLQMVEMSDRVRQIYLSELASSQKTFPYLMEVILSDRHPFNVMILAAKVGMYLPTNHRIGLSAYHFYLKNIRYYEKIFERANCQIPTLLEICLINNPVQNLMKFRDDEIFRLGTLSNRNYNDRREMLSSFVQANFQVHGNFTLQSNYRRCYNMTNKNILYQERNQKFLYGIGDLIKLCDLNQKVIWTNDEKRTPFSRFSLHLLRQRILEKFSQWKQADQIHPSSSTPDLYKLYCKLETILEADVKTNAGSYLGQPKISIKF